MSTFIVFNSLPKFLSSAFISRHTVSTGFYNLFLMILVEYLLLLFILLLLLLILLLHHHLFSGSGSSMLLLVQPFNTHVSSMIFSKHCSSPLVGECPNGHISVFQKRVGIFEQLSKFPKGNPHLVI